MKNRTKFVVWGFVGLVSILLFLSGCSVSPTEEKASTENSTPGGKSALLAASYAASVYFSTNTSGYYSVVTYTPPVGQGPNTWHTTIPSPITVTATINGAVYSGSIPETSLSLSNMVGFCNPTPTGTCSGANGTYYATYAGYINLVK